MDPQQPTDAEARRARLLVEQAQEIVERAKKSQAKPKFWGFLLGGDGNSNDNEDIADLYGRAGKLYSEAEQYKEAGKAYEDAATTCETGKSGKIITDALTQKAAARYRVEAFNAYRIVDLVEAMRCMDLALEAFRLYGDANSFARAAEPAAKFLEEKQDLKRAMDLYGEMGKRFLKEGKGATAAKHYFEDARLAALQGDYFRAVQGYEKTADLRLPTVPRYVAQTEYLNAGLCALATGDLVTAQRNVRSYIQRVPEFGGRPEGRLLLGLIEAIEARDHEAFSRELSIYDPMAKLSGWEAEILVRIKSQIEEADNEFA